MAIPNAFRTVLIVTLLWVGLLPAPAQANPGTVSDPTAEAREHYQLANQHYELGRWDEAIAEYMLAYELRPDPSFLYDLAQSYRRKGELKRAVDLYRNYLLKDPKTPLRREVEDRIAALEKQLDPPGLAERKDTAPPPSVVTESVATEGHPPSGPAPTESAPPPTVGPIHAAPALATEPTPTPAPTKRNWKAAKWIALGVGGAALATGAFFSWRTYALTGQLERADRYDPGVARAGQHAQTLQWVGYGVGAGAVAASAGLFLLEFHAHRSTTVGFAPWISDQMAGLSLGGGFQ